MKPFNKLSNESFSKAAEDLGEYTSVVTELTKKDTFTFDWTIKGFTGLGTEVIESPRLIGSSETQNVWILKAFKRWKMDKFKLSENLNLTVTLVEFGSKSPIKTLKLNLEASIISQNESSRNITKTLTHTFKQGVGFEIELISLEQFNDQQRGFLKDGKMIIRTRFSTCGNSLSQIERESPKDLKIVKTDWNHSNDNSNHSNDYLNETLGNVSLPRSTLPIPPKKKRGRPPKSQNSLTMRFSNTSSGLGLGIGQTPKRKRKATKGLIEEPDPKMDAYAKSMIEEMQEKFDPEEYHEAIRTMINFIKSGELEYVKELLIAAEISDVLLVKKVCENSIWSKIKVENAAEIFIFASLYRAEILLPKVIHFILTYQDEVERTPKYQNILESDKLMDLLVPPEEPGKDNWPKLESPSPVFCNAAAASEKQQPPEEKDKVMGN